MGNTPSQEIDGRSVYKAVANNDYVQLEKFINSLRANGRLNPQILGWVDKEGRTPLLVAASKNHHQCARKLLACGADVLYLNPCSDLRGGTALHEATRNRHEAMAEMLLEYGATPFQCNALGKTCMDEAVLASSANLLRRFEQLAPWSGHALVKSSTLAGMSQQYKARYVVVIPLYPAPVPAGPGQAPQEQFIRRQCWIYKDNTSLMPKCRVWLDGATVVRTGVNDAVLRLHPTHKPPQGDVYHRYDRGYCIYLRVKDSSTAAAAMLDSFVTTVNGATITQNPGGAAARPGAGVPTIQPPAAYPMLPPAALTGTGSVPALPSHPSQAHPSFQSAASTSHPSSTPSTTTTTPVASLTPYTSSGGGSGTLQGHGSGTVPVATAASPPTFSAVFGSVIGTGAASPGRTTPEGFVDFMNALPGETDAEFAARLASAMAAGSGQDQPSCTPSTTRPSASTPTLTSTRPSGPHDASGPTTSSIPAYPRVPSASATTAAAPPPLAEQPSAPPLTPPRPAGMATAPPAVTDDALCVICLSNPREAGYLHGQTLHRCVCRECCSEIKEGEPCPLCRLPVERVVGVF